MSDTLAPARTGIAFTDQQRLCWLRLIRSENVGPATFRDLINHFGTAENALDALPGLAARGGAAARVRVTPEADAEREIEEMSRIGARIVCLGEPGYPMALKAADSPPPVLTVRGNPDILGRYALGIVGSRNASASGAKFAGKLAHEVGKEGFAIISGLARGIDSAAHRASLATGTIAVFAGGIDYLYPPENGPLLEAIIDQGGAAITEMPFGWQPRAKDFPRRNRLIAGIGLGLLVVEAAMRSGSLISARLANEMGRLVFAVPGSPLDPRSAGTNGLLKQGAILTTESRDILEALAPLVDGVADQAPYSLEEREGDAPSDLDEPDDSARSRVFSALDHTPTDIDEIIRFTGLQPAVVQLVLLELDLAGLLERHGQGKVSRA